MAIEVMTRPHQLIASDRVEGTSVRRSNGDRIGHVERLMIDKVTGKVSYAIVSFGGFLGMGTSLLPLPWARLSYNTKFEAYQLDIDDDELRRAPSFAPTKSSTGAIVRRKRNCIAITESRLTGAVSDPSFVPTKLCKVRIRKLERLRPRCVLSSSISEQGENT